MAKILYKVNLKDTPHPINQVAQDIYNLKGILYY